MASPIEESIKKNVRIVPDFPKKGILFKDITPIFLNQELCNQITNAFIARLPSRPDAVLGIESRGFLFGFLMANHLNVPFILIRKAGKLPGSNHKENFELEYGTSALELQQDILKPWARVVVHDDILATGGTAAATARLVKKAHADILAFTFLIELYSLCGVEKLHTFTNHIICLAKY